METQFSRAALATASGRRANEILRSCVHCGLCNATCPTYQLLGDELDGPRGRIYLIKSLLEAPEPGRARVAQTHLDRCLTCRACETTCPSGVAYGELLEIGRDAADEQAARTLWQRMMRQWLGLVVPSIRWFPRWVALGRLLRWVLPARLKAALPGSPTASVAPSKLSKPVLPPVKPSSRRALLLQGCVQRTATPEVNAAVIRFFNNQGVETVLADGEGCCGGLNLHLGQAAPARQAMRRNLDALTPLLDQVEWVVSSASGCGVTVKDYGRLLADDPEYAAAASRLASMTRDLAEVAAELVGRDAPALASVQGKPVNAAGPAPAVKQMTPSPTFLGSTPAARDEPADVLGPPPRKVAWHPPCTLQHGQRISGLVEGMLAAAGYELAPVKDAHLCCGAAGTYALLQPELADQLKRNKLANLTVAQPQVIATANVGCQMHLASAADRPVVHWIQLLSRSVSDVA